MKSFTKLVDYERPFEEVEGDIRTALGFPQELESPGYLVKGENLHQNAVGPVVSYLTFIAESRNKTIGQICKAIHEAGQGSKMGFLGRFADKSEKVASVYESLHGHSGRGWDIVSSAHEKIFGILKESGYSSEDSFRERALMEGESAERTKLRNRLVDALQTEIPG